MLDHNFTHVLIRTFYFMLDHNFTHVLITTFYFMLDHNFTHVLITTFFYKTATDCINTWEKTFMKNFLC